MSGLDWPAGFDRTPPGKRDAGRKFQASRGSTTKELAAELERMDVDEWRASIGNQHTKSNGLPRHNARPDDPGFVLRWRDDGEQYAVACDAYSELAANVRAVYLWLHETRMRGQRPVVTGDTEFAAARLPPGDGEPDAVVAEPVEPDPHDVLGVAPDADPEVVKAAARSLKKKHHPDVGGDEQQFKRVVRAEQRMLEGER